MRSVGIARQRDGATNPTCTTRWKFYELDANLNVLSSQRLHVADVGRDRIFDSYRVDELLVDKFGVYAYATPFDMEYLLYDTLYILQRHDLPLLYKGGHFGEACIYPVRKGKRIQMATTNHTVNNSFTFCFDRSNYTAYLLSKGFKDDIYKTGYISDLQPMDCYNLSYCYIKSSADLPKKTQNSANNNPVLFIVTLHS